MTSMREYEFALKFRNAIRKIVLDTLARERPADKVGRVVDIDRSAGIATVVYASDANNPVRVKMYPSVQPQFSDRINGSGLGSVVRVSGVPGARYISQVLDGSHHQIFPRLVNPTFAAGGSGDTTIKSTFSFSSESVPIADSVSYFPVVDLHVPKNGATVDVFTEMLGPTGVSYLQRDTFRFDSTTTREEIRVADNVDFTSVGMSIEVYYYLYDASLEGLEVGTTGLLVYYLRDSTSTKSPESMNVHLECYGSDIQLIKFADGVF